MSSLRPKLRYLSPSVIYWLLIGVGIILAAESAALCSLLFASLLLPTLSFDWPHTLISAALAGLLVGLPGWYFFMPRQHQTMRCGVLMGIFGSITAHPIFWIIYALLISIFVPRYAGGIDPMMLFLATFGSLIIVGWITSLIGGIAGALLLQLQWMLTYQHKTDEKRQEGTRITPSKDGSARTESPE